MSIIITGFLIVHKGVRMFKWVPSKFIYTVVSNVHFSFWKANKAKKLLI